MKKKRIVDFIKTAMKITFFQTILSIIFICVALAGNMNAEILDRKITLSSRQEEISHLLKRIQKAASVQFVYNPIAIQVCRKISLHASNQPLSEVLDEILLVNNIHYRVVKDCILLFSQADEKATNTSDDNEAVRSLKEEAIDFIITGKVTDESGQSMPGVSIILKGTSMGVSSDVDGNFTLNIPEAQTNGVLIFSFVGYISSEVAINSQTVINFQLKPDVTSLGEVVIVAYGEQRKKNMVGANSSVNVSELKQPVSNIGTMLAGRIAGIVQVQRTGEPGRDAANIWIRGLSSWPQYGGVSPLVLIDGVERSLDNVDAQDVESFNILKDASATAVYGMRGANGVILIKTKSGKAGKTSIVANYLQGVTTFTKMPELADGPTFMRLTNEALTNHNKSPFFSNEQITRTESGEDPMVYPNVNWFDAVFNKHASNRRLNLNASGGNEKARYYVSAAYYNEDGFFKTDALQQYNSTTRFTRYNFTSNINVDVTKTTILDLGIQGYVSNVNYPGQASEDVFGQIMMTSPVAYPIMYPGGIVPGREVNGDFRNPYADISQRGYRNQFRNQVYSNIRVTQDLNFITPGLSFTSLFSFDAYNWHDMYRLKRKDTYFIDPINPRNPDGTLNLKQTYTSGSSALNYSRDLGGNRRFYSESAINYRKTFGQHYVTGMLLYSQTDYTNSSAIDFTESIPFRNKGIAGRVTYALKDRYFLEANFGYNGSENFAPKRRYGFFPSYGLGWVVSDENFFQSFKSAIQFFKLRFSDGLVGIAGGGRRFGYITILSNVGQPGYAYGMPGSTTGYGGITIQDYAVDVGWATSRKVTLV